MMSDNKEKPISFDEDRFQRTIRATPWFAEFVQNYGEEPDLNTNVYDYRAAIKAGVRPQRDPYDNGKFHWSSEFKAKDHPTMWKEQFMQLDPWKRNPDALGITSPMEASRNLLLKEKPISEAALLAKLLMREE